MTDTKTDTDNARQATQGAETISAANKPDSGTQLRDEDLDEKLKWFGSALDAAMTQGVGNHRKKWSRAALAYALSPPVDKSAIGLWITARRAITDQNAYEVFRVMSLEPLSNIEYAKLLELKDAYVAAFLERETSAVVSFVENCVRVEESTPEKEPENPSQSSNKMNAESEYVAEENAFVGSEERQAAAREVKDAKMPKTWFGTSTPWGAIGAIAAVVAAVFAVTQYFTPGSEVVIHEENGTTMTIRAGDSSNNNIGGSQIISEGNVTVPYRKTE